jgi:hypothetical protein
VCPCVNALDWLGAEQKRAVPFVHAIRQHTRVQDAIQTHIHSIHSGTAASQPIEIASGGLLHHVRSLLLLRPVALHDVWLRKVGAVVHCVCAWV